MDRLFTSRHHVSLTVWWNLSPLPVHGVESKCWRQLRDALYAAGTCFTRTFPQLLSPPPSCQPREKWCTSNEIKRSLIFDLPRYPPPKVHLCARYIHYKKPRFPAMATFSWLSLHGTRYLSISRMGLSFFAPLLKAKKQVLMLVSFSWNCYCCARLRSLNLFEKTYNHFRISLMRTKVWIKYTQWKYGQ